MAVPPLVYVRPVVSRPMAKVFVVLYSTTQLATLIAVAIVPTTDAIVTTSPLARPCDVEVTMAG
ncbi:MAG: hypothetical protein IPH55_17090 [Betaproteobacteria bacterium]|nr:hypothetical protein [Betaproteobacteria bacterium]